MQGEDFVRVQSLGIEYACSCGKAVACRWGPTPDKGERAEIQEVVVTSGCEFRVELFTSGIFSKSFIRSVSIPKTVKFLPKKCFECCEQFVHVIFASESQIDSFGDACFKRCGLSEIEVPDSCLSIGSKCFDGCERLCRVGIGERSQLERVGEFAFRGCMVSDFYIPDDLALYWKTLHYRK